MVIQRYANETYGLMKTIFWLNDNYKGLFRVCTMFMVICGIFNLQNMNVAEILKTHDFEVKNHYWLFVGH